MDTSKALHLSWLVQPDNYQVNKASRCSIQPYPIILIAPPSGVSKEEFNCTVAVKIFLRSNDDETTEISSGVNLLEGMCSYFTYRPPAAYTRWNTIHIEIETYYCFYGSLQFNATQTSKIISPNCNHIRNDQRIVTFQRFQRLFRLSV